VTDGGSLDGWNEAYQSYIARTVYDQTQLLSMVGGFSVGTAAIKDALWLVFRQADEDLRL
jgi:hypothetical protein